MILLHHPEITLHKREELRERVGARQKMSFLLAKIHPANVFPTGHGGAGRAIRGCEPWPFAKGHGTGF